MVQKYIGIPQNRKDVVRISQAEPGERRMALREVRALRIA